MAAAGDPDARDGGGGGGGPVVGAGEGRHVGAAGGDAEEGGGEALNVDGTVPGAGDEEGLAVEAGEGRERPRGEGRVDGILEGAVGVLGCPEGFGLGSGTGLGRRWGRCDGDGAAFVVDYERGRPGEALDCLREDVAVRSGVVWGEEEAVVGVVVLLKVEGDTGEVC